MTELEKLEYLKQSETVRLVLEGKHTPQDLDSAYKNMKKQIVKLQNESFADKAEIMRLRRYIELLTRAEEESK
jgi:nitrogen fixation/metabolism regulation signal transduction histidine kinase